MRIAFLLAAVPLLAQQQQPGWWMRQPIRWVQTNLRETDAALDPARLIQQTADYHANVLHFSAGGIVAFYPTKLPFHYASPYLNGRDLLGEVTRLAHQRNIRIVARYDFSKTRREVYDAHPEWFFRKADGSPVIYNGLYSTCINGGYYREHALKILHEALDRYPLDGLFFNMFGNQSRDYSGNFVGHCHCDNCVRRYREQYGKPLPGNPDQEYRRFMFRSSREVAAAIRKLIRSKGRDIGYFNYIQEYTDGIMSESNTALSRPLPLWPYSASDNVNRARNSEPGKMSVNLCMQFVDYAWRFATVPAHEITLRLWQNLADGGALALALNGTFDQEDRQAIEAARPIFAWAAGNQSYYVNQESAAKVLLLGAPAGTGRTYSQTAYRGLFRFLSEEHIPFAVSDNMDWLGRRQFDLVIATDWAPKELAAHIQAGGRVLIVSASQPEIDTPPILATHRNIEGYFRVRNRQIFPSLRDTNLIMLNGPYTEVAPSGAAALTLIPPSMIGPPEKIHVDMKNTDKAGVVFMNGGRAAWIPWDLGTLYHRLSLPAHKALLHDLVAGLLPQRQLTTNAHPLVEISLMRQGNRTLLHLINLSGHSQTAYFPPVPMSNLEFTIQGTYRTAAAVQGRTAINPFTVSGQTRIAVPTLKEYEVIVLE